MTFDYGAAIRERIAAEVAEHGEVPPPWAAFPDFGLRRWPAPKR